MLGSTSQTSAQLSPGKLSAPHAHLEGLTRCSRCHQLGNREVQDKCLDCHAEIAASRADQRGPHASDDFDHCVDCHVEHHGADYDLVFWPDGRDGFDHSLTEFLLTGAHQKLACRQCHTAAKVTQPQALQAMGKDLDRTYLGLEAACISCHEDIHRAQFTRECTGCHDTQQWKPAPGFDHDATPFPLTGRHVQTDCAKCHQPDPDTGTVRYAALSHQACTDCHRDPHAGSLGVDCVRCHSTEGWKSITGEGFDHARTRYPLEGRHRQVSCAQCHGQDRQKLAFAACTDCHQDWHRAIKNGRPAFLACENCHTVDGFQPATFTMARHQDSAFPLKGAHRATPCVACHQPLAEGTTRPRTRLTMAHGQCVDCHRDPHPAGMQQAAPGSRQGCAACHDQESWRIFEFDHLGTGFALENRHATIACAACHKNPSPADFTGLDTACAACHEDIHRGQFADRKTADDRHIACDRCHVTRDWLAEKFDHEKDSRFPLRGGHERTPCLKCHLPGEENDPRLVQYKPLPTDCKDCHAGALPGKTPKESS
nr:hypothetical protein [Candidatus Krumholzibacteria bacterium]